MNSTVIYLSIFDSILESIKKIPDGFRNALNEAIQKVIKAWRCTIKYYRSILIFLVIYIYFC